MKKHQRPCREVGCTELTRETWCEIHKKNAQETSRSYNKYMRNDRENTFYQSSQWQRLRKLALERDNHLCQSCLKQGVLQQAQIVHHIEWLRDDWSKRLELNNLECLCHKCHNRQHKHAPPGS